MDLGPWIYALKVALVMLLDPDRRNPYIVDIYLERFNILFNHLSKTCSNKLKWISGMNVHQSIREANRFTIRNPVLLFTLQSRLLYFSIQPGDEINHLRPGKKEKVLKPLIRRLHQQCCEYILSSTLIEELNNNCLRTIASAPAYEEHDQFKFIQIRTKLR
jgi:hypothetical protein